MTPGNFLIETSRDTDSGSPAAEMKTSSGSFTAFAACAMVIHPKIDSAGALCVVFAAGFAIIGLPLGILLGILLGVMSMVPYLQVLGAIPAVMVAAIHALETGESFWLVLGLTGLVFVAAQIVQDVILVPRIMGKAMGLSPAAMLLSLSIWGKLLGMLGLIIALPMTCLVLAYYRRLVLSPAGGQVVSPVSEIGGDG